MLRFAGPQRVVCLTDVPSRPTPLQPAQFQPAFPANNLTRTVPVPEKRRRRVCVGPAEDGDRGPLSQAGQGRGAGDLYARSIYKQVQFKNKYLQTVFFNNMMEQFGYC